MYNNLEIYTLRTDSTAFVLSCSSLMNTVPDLRKQVLYLYQCTTAVTTAMGLHLSTFLFLGPRHRASFLSPSHLPCLVWTTSQPFLLSFVLTVDELDMHSVPPKPHRFRPLILLLLLVCLAAAICSILYRYLRYNSVPACLSSTSEHGEPCSSRHSCVAHIRSRLRRPFLLRERHWMLDHTGDTRAADCCSRSLQLVGSGWRNIK